MSAVDRPTRLAHRKELHDAILVLVDPRRTPTTRLSLPAHRQHHEPRRSSTESTRPVLVHQLNVAVLSLGLHRLSTRLLGCALVAVILSFGESDHIADRFAMIPLLYLAALIACFLFVMTFAG